MKKLKKFDFKTVESKSKYNWDEILNGDINQLTRRDDFTSIPGAFGAMCRYQAAMRYKRVHLSVDETSVTVQAYDMTAEEKDIEDARRAKQEAAFKARVEKNKAAKVAAKEGGKEEIAEPEVSEAAA